jgi:hypothetical protein
MPNFDEIEKNLEAMLKLAADKLQLLQGQYGGMSEEDKKVCAGRSTKDWAEFKEATIEFQAKHGLVWSAVQARGGPLKLVKIVLPGELGKDLAQELLQQGRQEGNLRGEVQNKLPLLADAPLNMVELDMTELREQFKGQTWNKERFVFARGLGSDFHRVKDITTFAGSEKILARFIEEQGLFEDLFGFEIYNFRGGAPLGYLHNVDFCGLRIIKRPEGDHIELTAIELKKDNNISSIMQGIAQATSYRNLAEYCYIAAPGMSAGEFYDQERYAEIGSLCEQNDIGIISLNLDPENKHVESAEIALIAKRGQLDNPDLLNHVLEKSKLEFCPLCRRYVEKDIENRTRCGWKTREDECMRSRLEEMATKTS